MSKWIELANPMFAWVRYDQGGSIYPVLFHGLVSEQEMKGIHRRYDLKADEASLPIDELVRRYPIDGSVPSNAEPAGASRDETGDPFEGRLSTATFVLGVTALLLFILAALIFPA